MEEISTLFIKIYQIGMIFMFYQYFINDFERVRASARNTKTSIHSLFCIIIYIVLWPFIIAGIYLNFPI